MMNEDNQVERRKRYFEWIVSLVAVDRWTREYSKLLYAMHTVEFHNTVYMDKNRISDVYAYLRDEYEEISGENDFAEDGVSVLEVLIGLSRRIVEMLGDDNCYGITVDSFFWEMVSNMGLTVFEDRYLDEEEEDGYSEIEDILTAFVERRYGADEGPFPVSEDLLRKSRKMDIFVTNPDFKNVTCDKYLSQNVTKSELWSQAMTYLNVFYPFV